MKIVKQSVNLLTQAKYEDLCRIVEEAGRTCYKSNKDEFNLDDAERFIKMILDSKHESVIEHVSLTFKIITNRAIANEIVRHRIASYSQESTRYCNYSKDKFNNELTFIEPLLEDEEYKDWLVSMNSIEDTYMKLIDKEIKPDIIRGILPLDLKTEIVMTMNIRSLRNFLGSRLHSTAHPQIKEIAHYIYNTVKEKYPIFVYGLEIE